MEVWKCAFHILLTEDAPEILPSVPFAESLFEILESERSSSRRDPDKLCDLIALVAWLRRFQKASDYRDRADFIDLFTAFQIGLDAISQTMSDLDEKESLIFEAIKALGDNVSIRDVTDKTKIPYETNRRYLDRLVDKGFLNKDKVSNKNFYSILSENKDDKLIISAMRRYSDPKKLTETILKAVDNSSTHHRVSAPLIKFYDPLDGSQILVTGELKDDKMTYTVETKPLEEIDENKKELLYPHGEMRRSERVTETASEQEKEPINLPIGELVRNKSPEIQDAIDKLVHDGKLPECHDCKNTVYDPRQLTNLDGHFYCKTCFAKILIQKGKPQVVGD